MSSSAQVLANRQNSTHSTGPKTAAGKATSSANATRHGLTSKHIVIAGEDAAEYDAQRESLLKEYLPSGETERILVEEIAASAWRLVRARRFETAVLQKLLGGAADPAAAFAEAFLQKPKELERLQRYVNTIERAYFRALNKLQKMQNERKKESKKRPVCITWVDEKPVAKPANGFVSQLASALPLEVAAGADSALGAAAARNTMEA
jgi:hypothetical protein